MIKMTLQETKEYIDNFHSDRLLVRHTIECLEIELCKDDYASIDELKYFKSLDDGFVKNGKRIIQYMTEKLAEDEILNGWKGEDRYIEFEFSDR